MFGWLFTIDCCFTACSYNLAAHFLMDVTKVKEYKDKLVPLLEWASSLILLALGLYVLTQM